MAVAQVEHLGEDAGDVVGQPGDKPGDRGEVRLGVAGQGDEGDVMTADGFDIAAGDDALAVGEQHDLEQHGGRIGGRAGCVILEPGIKAGQIKFVVDEVVEGVLKGAREQLSLQVNGKKTRAGVDVLLARHAVGSFKKPMRRC